MAFVKHKNPVSQRLCLVIVNSRDSRLDYWMTREQLDKIGLQEIEVYSDERTWHDPGGRYRHLRWDQ